MSAKLPKCIEPVLEPGSIVQLRSGGHSMVIDSIDGSVVTCVWSDKGRVRTESLSAHVLKRSAEGTDAILIIPGLNASEDDFADLMGRAKNA